MTEAAPRLVARDRPDLILGDAQQEAKFLAEQMALWGPVVKENNIKSD